MMTQEHNFKCSILQCAQRLKPDSDTSLGTRLVHLYTARYHTILCNDFAMQQDCHFEMTVFYNEL